MRGVITEPAQRTFSFDGQALYQVSFAEKQFVRYSLELSREKSLLLLSQTFSPFAPEGFRVPLLKANQLTARKVKHRLAPEAVEVGQTVQEGEKSIPVAYTFRWPSLDFLEKRMGDSRLEVEEEHCDAALKLCVPKRLSQWVGAERAFTTSLSEVELNPALVAEDFTLAPPEGFEVKAQPLLD
jgi:hypothetical protein